MNPSLRIAAVFLLMLPTCALAREHCEYRMPQQSDIALTGISTVVVDIGRHHLTLSGADKLSGIELRGRACASSSKLLASLKVVQKREGDRLVIQARGGDDVPFSLFGNRYAYINLKVRVPTGAAVEVDVGGGDATVSDLDHLVASVDSGDITIERVKHRLDLAVASGDATVEDVGQLAVGAVGSGNAKVKTVRGDASVGNIGTGDVDLRSVAGNVTIGAIGSGDARLRDVGGNVRVESIDSGDVDVDTVGGNLSVGSIGSGDVSHSDVKGTISLPQPSD